MSSLTISKRASPSGARKSHWTGKLQAGEAALLAELPAAGDELVIDKANGKKVQSVGNRFRKAIEKEHRNKYYKANAGYTAFGIGSRLPWSFCLFIFGDLHEDVTR